MSLIIGTLFWHSDISLQGTLPRHELSCPVVLQLQCSLTFCWTQTVLIRAVPILRVRIP